VEDLEVESVVCLLEGLDEELEKDAEVLALEEEGQLLVEQQVLHFLVDEDVLQLADAEVVLVRTRCNQVEHELVQLVLLQHAARVLRAVADHVQLAVVQLMH